jgi:hypothetical protein
VVVSGNPLLLSTFSIPAFSESTSAINSHRPASRAILPRWRINNAPMPCRWYWSRMANAASAVPGATTTYHSAYDRSAVVLTHLGEQGDVIGEVDIYKEGDFVLRKLMFRRKKATLKGVRADAASSTDEVVPIFWSERPNLHLASSSQCLYR